MNFRYVPVIERYVGARPVALIELKPCWWRWQARLAIWWRGLFIGDYRAWIYAPEKAANAVWEYRNWLGVNRRER